MIALRERYVAAVLQMIPMDARADIEQELRNAIDDAIDEKVEEGMAGADAERAVLTELGDPARLAADYSNRPLWVIGPAYYLAWLRLMGLMLRFLPALIGGITFFIRLATGQHLLGALLNSVFVAIIVALNAVVWPTIGFIIAERSQDVTHADLDPLARWRIEQLPATGADRQFALLAAIGRIVVNLVVIAALSAVHSLSEVPIVSAAAWNIAIPVLIGLLIASSVFAVVRYRQGRWTIPLAVANTFLNTGFATWWTWVLWDLALLDSGFVARVNASSVLTITAGVIAVVIVAACVWDTIDGITGARLERRRATAPA